MKVTQTLLILETKQKNKQEIQEKLNEKHKNTKDSTFIISPTIIMKLHNTFNVCRL